MVSNQSEWANNIEETQDELRNPHKWPIGDDKREREREEGGERVFERV